MPAQETTQEVTGVTLEVSHAQGQSPAELQAQIAALSADREHLNGQVGELTAEVQRLTTIERQGRAEREVAGQNNDGVPWRGDTKANVARYLKMDAAFAGDPEAFEEFVQRERDAATALATSAAFNEVGSDSTARPSGSARAELDGIAQSIRESRAAVNGKPMSYEESFVEAMARHPELKDRYQQEGNGKAARR